MRHSFKNDLYLNIFKESMVSGGGAVVKNPPTDAGAAGDPGLIPAEKVPGGVSGKALQYSC